MGKKHLGACEKLEKPFYPLQDGIKKLKDLAYAKFDESVDVSVRLGIDATKSDQVVRGSVLLPNGNGRIVKVIVFAKGDYAQKATQAGADYVGCEDLIEKIESGWLDFNYAVATPDVMGQVGRLAKLLGPKGLLPNKKLGTITFDTGDIVKELKSGRSFFKNDKGGSVHFSIGKRSFDVNKLAENFSAFIKSLVAQRPISAKGRFLRKVVISSTMGVGIPIVLDDELKV
jgi:large subunit ribosomal protein L1